jgi:PAS domain S-box-containing protein
MTMLSSSDDLPLHVLWQDGERVFCRTWRVGADGERQEFLAVRSAAEHPTPGAIARLTREYELRDYLNGGFAVRPLELVHERGQTVLVLESPDAGPLGPLVIPAMDIGRFLRLAISLSGALARLHERGLIHMDIKPANILVSSPADRVWLTGFGLASRLARERQSPSPPELIAGTLAYMAPEQTGRMNRSIDSRSDLYALGATLYEMLTGSLPFNAAEPMEWIHCHIARQPVPPADRAPGVPSAISTIVMKLLAKAAEDRYQTAAGLEQDLRRCLADWETQGRIDPFPFGEHDIPGRLLVPEKLYGRERDIDTLLAAFDGVLANVVPELVLVSGYSGIGKSAVVNELHKVLVLPHGLFASGKFDQYKRDIPYATLAQAFQRLIRQLLGLSEADLARWRDNLVEALGPNGLLIVDLIPELKVIIGEQPPVPELPSLEAKARFQLVFRRFISVFARPEHPLALFLDDLQWLDAATLDLIESLLTQQDVRYLLLIGAYRDNEISPDHPLTRTLEAIRQSGAKTRHVILAPLTSEDLTRLVADTLHCDLHGAAPLAQLILDKTAGNPFFAIQFISALVEEGLLTFDHRDARWRWDLSRIEAKGYTDNVADLMVGKLNRLPVGTKEALKKLACLGNSAEVTFLSMVQQAAEHKVHADLWEARRAELVQRSENSYRFVHDRVQEAAYSLISEAERAAAHLRIGRLLLAHIAADEREDAIFEIVAQFDRGAALITSCDEREQIAELYLIAGKRAKASAAYASALWYLVSGAALLPDDRWERRHDLIFQLELHRAECELLTGGLDNADERLSFLSSRAVTPVEQSAVEYLRVDLHMTLGRPDRAVSVCLDYLKKLGIEWSPHPTEEEAQLEYERVWSRLGNRAIEELIELPLMSDSASLATVDVLTKALEPALMTDANLLCLAACRTVNLSLQYGNSDGSCLGYVWLGMIARTRFGSHKDGFRFGRLGFELVERKRLKRFQGRTYISFVQFVPLWTEHIRICCDLSRQAFEVTNKLGDLTYATYSLDFLSNTLLVAGQPLADVQSEVEFGLAFAKAARFGFEIDIHTARLGLIRTLRGLTPKFGSFDGESLFEEHLAIDQRLRPDLECWYLIDKLQARFLAGDNPAALDASRRAQRLLSLLPATFIGAAEYHFYSALCFAASIEFENAEGRQEHFKALSAHHRQIEDWAMHCPENFENRAALVGAEIARIEGRELEAMRLYERAFHSARGNGFVNNEALANELAARFYSARGFETIANAYLREARACYQRWGADGKVRQLETLHPGLRESTSGHAGAVTITTPTEQADFETVIKVSQALSGEIVMDRLVDALMRLAIEHAGAERGVLLLSRGNELRQEAEAVTSGDGVIVSRRNESAAALPESIVRYVTRAREILILGDALADPRFSADFYVRERNARSVMCLPLVTDSKFTGVLYLENKLTPHVFTPSRIAVLKSLALQAAISLENSHLYSDLAEREAKIRRLVDASIIGIVIGDLDGRIVDANDAFLRMVGHERADIMSGLRWPEMSPPEWRGADEQRVEEMKATGVAQPYEKELFKKDGSRVPVLAGAAIFDEARGQAVAFVLDLTDLKRAEEGLRRSEAFLAKGQTLSLTGTFSWDFETGAFIWSEELYRIYEFESGTPTTFERIATRYHPEDEAVIGAVAEQARSRVMNFDYEHRLLMPDGSIKRVHVVAHGNRNKDGRLEYFGAVQDITQRHLANEALNKARTELAHMARITSLGALERIPVWSNRRGFPTAEQ